MWEFFGWTLLFRATSQASIPSSYGKRGYNLVISIQNIMELFGTSFKACILCRRYGVSFT